MWATKFYLCLHLLNIMKLMVSLYHACTQVSSNQMILLITSYSTGCIERKRMRLKILLWLFGLTVVLVLHQLSVTSLKMDLLWSLKLLTKPLNLLNINSWSKTTLKDLGLITLLWFILTNLLELDILSLALKFSWLLWKKLLLNSLLSWTTCTSCTLSFQESASILLENHTPESTSLPSLLLSMRLDTTYKDHLSEIHSLSLTVSWLLNTLLLRLSTF